MLPAASLAVMTNGGAAPGKVTWGSATQTPLLLPSESGPKPSSRTDVAPLTDTDTETVRTPRVHPRLMTFPPPIEGGVLSPGGWVVVGAGFVVTLVPPGPGATASSSVPASSRPSSVPSSAVLSSVMPSAAPRLVDVEALLDRVRSPIEVWIPAVSTGSSSAPDVRSSAPSTRTTAAATVSHAMRRRRRPRSPVRAAKPSFVNGTFGPSMTSTLRMLEMTRVLSSAGAGTSGAAASSASGLTTALRFSAQISQPSTCRATRLRSSGENFPSQPVSRASSSSHSARPMRAMSSAPRDRST